MQTIYKYIKKAKKRIRKNGVTLLTASVTEEKLICTHLFPHRDKVARCRYSKVKLLRLNLVFEDDGPMVTVL